ncbi:PEPxxWA-CTERM sorting domain-containing protein [Glacieibacterium frigidum]|uniref:PEPxxWA-CTERM sorting domain-containing protein n=1 Tax=Glacieibacterium frigidum TaxID=2593303 RepID=UPI001F3D5901|nr:PEPxxWA-CTERM sorting domain-containing protein [Glacieibacterium frigidum]
MSWSKHPTARGAVAVTIFAIGLAAALIAAPARGGTTLAATGATVPEPGTWAMLLAGFAGVGAAARRRRRGQVVAA